MRDSDLTISELAEVVRKRQEAEARRRAELPIRAAKEREVARRRRATQLEVDRRHAEWLASRPTKWELKQQRKKEREDRRAEKRRSKLTLPPRGPRQPQNSPDAAKFYGRRNNLLARMGYESYDAYRASQQWNAIRSHVFARDAKACRLCGAPATEVHHAAYDMKTLNGENLQHLYAVCRQCHERVEFFPGGTKRRSPKEMRTITEFLAAERAAVIEAVELQSAEIDEEFRYVTSRDKAPQLQEPQAGLSSLAAENTRDTLGSLPERAVEVGGWTERAVCIPGNEQVVDPA